MEPVKGMGRLTAWVASRSRDDGVAPVEPPELAPLWRAIERGARDGVIHPTPLAGAADVADEDAATCMIAAALAAAAVAETSERHFIHYWMSETLRGWFAEFGPFAGPMAAARTRFQNMVTLGINLRGRDDAEFLSAWHHVVAPAAVRPSSAFAAAVACTTFAGGDLARAFRLAGRLGDVAWAASLTLARLAGCFYGVERLRIPVENEGWDDLVVEQGRE